MDGLGDRDGFTKLSRTHPLRRTAAPSRRLAGAFQQTPVEDPGDARGEARKIRLMPGGRESCASTSGASGRGRQRKKGRASSTGLLCLRVPPHRVISSFSVASGAERTISRLRSVAATISPTGSPHVPTFAVVSCSCAGGESESESAPAGKKRSDWFCLWDGFPSAT